MSVSPGILALGKGKIHRDACHNAEGGSTLTIGGCIRVRVIRLLPGRFPRTPLPGPERKGPFIRLWLSRCATGISGLTGSPLLRPGMLLASLADLTGSRPGDGGFHARAFSGSVTGAAASRSTMNITTGLGSGVASATVAGRPSRSFRCFLSLTRITAYWLAVRRSADTAWSSALGKRRFPRSKLPIGCLILPRSAAGRAAWTALNRQIPFCAEHPPAWFTGWRVAIRRIPMLGCCRG